MSLCTLYHNPRCSKSRELLVKLRERGIEPTIIEYLKTPLSESALQILLKQLNLKAHDLLRTQEALYQTLTLSKHSPDDIVIAAIKKHPILMQRPILVSDNKAAIGRPPEQALAILR